ncbi:MAG: DNA-3-methyladenine glycosylase family protein, partial [Methylohalobius sp.]
MTSPSYWPLAKRYLSRTDSVMAALIERYPEALSRRGDSFETLVRAIVGQQISTKAAAAVCQRLEACIGRITPEAILSVSPYSLQQAGLSRAKANYLRQLAAYYLEHQVSDAYWQRRPYAEIRQELLRLKGIGDWTVEMFAIFHLHEPDVFSPADIGLQKAVSRLYLAGVAIDRERLAEFSKRWCPYRTVAAWYLWRHLDPV